MNPWLESSIQFANQRNYLDELFHVYPTIPEGIRVIDDDLQRRISAAFRSKKNTELIKVLLELDLFPGPHAWGGNKSEAFFRKHLGAAW